MANEDKIKENNPGEPVREVLREVHAWLFKPTVADLERIRKQADEMGIPDSLDDLTDTARRCSMPTVFEVADYIVAEFYENEDLADDLITHMKLQKLVYYAQSFSVFRLGQPLIGERIEAWEHGPVCPQLYERYKHFRRHPITVDLTLNDLRPLFSIGQMEVMDTVVAIYGPYGASELRRISHSDEAWIEAYKKANHLIGLEGLKKTGIRHFAVGKPIPVKLSPEELEFYRKQADEEGLPDSLDCLKDLGVLND
jgi:uncharacterized phage-associated protein